MFLGVLNKNIGLKWVNHRWVFMPEITKIFNKKEFKNAKIDISPLLPKFSAV